MTCSTLSRLLLLLVALAHVGSALGQPKDARSLLAEGNQQYQLGHFAEATAAYEQAFELSSAPGLLYNLAQCHRMEGHFERAAFYYQRYLSAAQPPIANEALARQLLVESQTKAEQQARAAEVAARAEQARRSAVDEVLKADEARKRADVEVARYEDARRGLLELEQARPATPLTKKWWFWTAIGVVAVGAGSAAAVVATRPGRPAASLGDVSF